MALGKITCRVKRRTLRLQNIAGFSQFLRWVVAGSVTAVGLGNNGKLDRG